MIQTSLLIFKGTFYILAKWDFYISLLLKKTSKSNNYFLKLDFIVFYEPLQLIW